MALTLHDQTFATLKLLFRSHIALPSDEKATPYAEPLGWYGPALHPVQRPDGCPCTEVQAASQATVQAVNWLTAIWDGQVNGWRTLNYPSPLKDLRELVNSLIGTEGV